MNQDTPLQRFNRLSNDDKYTLLEEQGVYLKAFYLHGAFKIALFSLWSYYVETLAF